MPLDGPAASSPCVVRGQTPIIQCKVRRHKRTRPCHAARISANPTRMTTPSKRVVTAARPHCLSVWHWVPLLAVSACLSAPFLPDCVEISRAGETGTIFGQIILGNSGVLPAPKVVAVDRASGKRYSGTIDMKTGKLTIDDLPLEAAYDCVVDYGGGRLEGVDLSVPPSDYEEEQPLVEDDLATLKDTVLSLNKFEDQVEVLAIEGNIEHAAVLVNKLRTRPFVNSKPGEVVWRVELWQFERPDDTWVKVQEKLFQTLYRERLDRAAFEAKAIVFTPALGGIRLTADRPTAGLGQVELPRPERGVRFVAREQIAVGLNTSTNRSDEKERP